MKTLFFAAAFLLIQLPGPILFADDAQDSQSEEDDFFGTGRVEAEEGAAEAGNIGEELDQERVGLSGNLEAVSSYTFSRDFFAGTAASSDNMLGQTIAGDFLLDIRLKKGFKAFLDVNIGYVTNGAPVTHMFHIPSPGFPPTFPAGTILPLSENTTTLIGIKEAFVDFNLANTVFFRLGKQVLQWGAGTLWNPTDLINIERRSFLNLDALRQGTYGLKTDVVFARELHLFTFLDFNNVNDIIDVAFAARAELLSGTLELGISGWLKREKIPVYGLDLTFSPFWELDVHAEAALSWGFQADKMHTDGSPYPIRDELVPRISAGVSRSFDAFDVLDRVRVSLEAYYNHAGYSENMIEALANDATYLPLFISGHYVSGDYGMLYGAFFVTISKFMASELAFSLSGICNFSDLSGIAVAELAWSPVSNFSLALGASVPIGVNLREYTFSYDPVSGRLKNNALSLSANARVAF